MARYWQLAFVKERKNMKKLAWASVFLCIFTAASFAAEPDAAGTPNAAGGASKGAVATGGGMSSGTAVVVTATVVTIATGAAIAAVVSGSSGTTPTTNH